MRRHLPLILALALVSVAATIAGAAEPPAAPRAKPPAAMALGPGVEPLPHAYQGPFVNMPDVAIVAIEQNPVSRSTDAGVPWAQSEIFSDGQTADLNLKISNERPLLLTRDGTLVPGCMNLNSRDRTWDKNIHAAPGAV